MKPRKRLLTVVLTLALGLGVWTLAISLTAAGFSDGDILSADDLNTLLNGNYDAITAEFNKFDSTGGRVTGRTDIVGDAISDTGLNTLFYADNRGDSGSAAVFQSNNDSDAGAVSIKQQGTGPALSLKSNGGGPMISGASSLQVTFLVEDNGSIKIGNMGNGSGDPVIHLDAVEGTVTNNVGSGLPLGFGYVNLSGDRVSGTSNFSAARVSTGTYEVTFTGESYSRTGYASFIQGASPSRYTARADATGGKLQVQIYNASGNLQDGAFHFVTYKDGN